MKRPSRLLLCIAAASAIAGCKAEDRDRPTSFQAGTYRGDAMPTLDAAKIKDLEKRGGLLK